MAVEDVNKNDDLLPGWNLNFVAANVGASTFERENDKNGSEGNAYLSSIAIRRMTEMRERGVAVFIGPDRRCTTEAMVAAAWNIPMISYVST